jgi:pimeloyl-ACP methyl ester carboxylesterase
MRYVEQGPTDSPDVTVLLHGWPDSSYSFSRLTPTLAALGQRTLSVDQRGFGGSSRPPSGYRIEDLAEDAAAFLDNLGLPPVTLIGHSMGTFVARRVAQLRPERVRALVLIGTAVTANNAVLREVATLVQDLPDPVPVEFARKFQAGTLHLPVPQAFFDRLVTESGRAPARVWRDVALGLLAHADASQLGGIAVPTLVLGGTEDALFLPLSSPPWPTPSPAPDSCSTPTPATAQTGNAPTK